MQIYGIYVPDRDASWEIDGTAGAGLDGSQERRVPCDARVGPVCSLRERLARRTLSDDFRSPSISIRET